MIGDRCVKTVAPILNKFYSQLIEPTRTPYLSSIEKVNKNRTRIIAY